MFVSPLSQQEPFQEGRLAPRDDGDLAEADQTRTDDAVDYRNRLSLSRETETEPSPPEDVRHNGFAEQPEDDVIASVPADANKNVVSKENIWLLV